ncbi:MAG: FHA domain-containing protein [Deltaproteobacteria bacterium]|nr:FHA domain-containing protein [Deltaproteobacteria bacterium]MBW2052910.1 FHA domain-containing protein [Deltaproteobacteria bacterium]MBW2141546.1 FHA domain-containing protein [Deltaproteobacteria bacterium]MBW2323384.1 FHA domain-containing protein [Deltaproteobacteria bacterium]
MPVKIKLHAVKGKLQGKVYAFDERATCIIGRGKDCNPKLPDDEDHQFVSRHHCLLDINPPDIRVRDLGSLNGTFVNGNKIGQRKEDQSPEDVDKNAFPEHDLKDGDEIELGNTVLRVEIEPVAVCLNCGKDIPEDKKDSLRLDEGTYRCESCRQKPGKAEPGKPVAEVKSVVCALCGQDVSKEIGENRKGVYICASCKSKPHEIIKMLVTKADEGVDALQALHGYSIIKQIGRGTSSIAYLAKHKKNGQEVALKMMLPEVAVDDVSRQRFLREVEITKALKHSNVVQLRDSGDYAGIFFFTLEYCNLGSIDKLRDEKGGKLPLEEALEIILQTLDGLEYIHTVEIPNIKLSNGRTESVKGLVHRDLKPANLLLAGSEEKRLVKIADVGVGKAFDTAGLSGQTRTGTVGGTPVYMPRQQVINFKYAKPDVDVWAIAATLYNLLTGTFARDFKKDEDPWRIVLQSQPVPIRKRNPSLPEKVAEVIDLALVDQPTITFKSAIEFKRTLEGVI